MTHWHEVVTGEKAQEKSLVAPMISTGLSERVCYAAGGEW